MTRKILIEIAAVAIIYFAFVFIETELNPINFSIPSKIFFLIFLAISVIGSIIIMNGSGEKQPDHSGDFEVNDADLSNWKNEVAEKN